MNEIYRELLMRGDYQIIEHLIQVYEKINNYCQQCLVLSQQYTMKFDQLKHYINDHFLMSETFFDFLDHQLIDHGYVDQKGKFDDLVTSLEKTITLPPNFIQSLKMYMDQLSF